MTTTMFPDEKLYQSQRKNPIEKIPTDIEGLFQFVVEEKLVVEEIFTVPEFKILFKYWFHNFNGDIDLIFGACLQLDFCASLIIGFSSESPRNFAHIAENYANENRKYLDAYETIKQTSELLNIPFQILTFNSDFPVSLNQPNTRMFLPRLPAMVEMLRVAKIYKELTTLFSGTTPKRTTTAAWAIRYLWKNISIDRQHIIEGHSLLGNRWKLIESLLDCLGNFEIDQNSVRLTLRRNPPTPTPSGYKFEPEYSSYEERDRAFFE